MTGTLERVGPPQPTIGIARRRRRIRPSRVLFLLLLGLVIATAGYLGFVRAYLGVSDPRDAFKLLLAGGDVVWNRIVPAPPFGGRKQVNILVLGADVSFERSGTARTDTIKLMHVDLAAPSICVLSIPRDTWVPIPGHGHGRINGAYQLGGARESDRIAMAKETVQGLLDDLAGREVPIDYYVRIQAGGFVHIVDALGGVEVDVEKAMKYSDPSQELYIDLQPGRQLLDGQQAMGYVRFRMDAEGDYGRIRRQDQFLRALAAQMQRPEERKRLRYLVGPIMKMLVTDIDESDLLALKSAVEKVGVEGIYTVTLPTEPTWKGAASVVEVKDRELAARTINEVLTGPRPTVVLLNGTDRSGLALEVRMSISADEFNVLGVGTIPEPVATSEVIAVPRRKQEARKLADLLGVKDVVTGVPAPAAEFGKKTAPPPPPPADITVVLGGDFTSVPEGSERAALP